MVNIQTDSSFLKVGQVQYDMLVCLVYGTNNSSTMISSDLGHTKLFIFIFVILQKDKRNKFKGFLQRNLQDFMKNKQTARLKIILGTLGAWCTSHFSHQPSKFYFLLFITFTRKTN